MRQGFQTVTSANPRLPDKNMHKIRCFFKSHKLVKNSLGHSKMRNLNEKEEGTPLAKVEGTPLEKVVDGIILLARTTRSDSASIAGAH